MTGCSWWLRITAAVIALVLALYFFRQAVWYHRHVDDIMRLPFVFGSFFIGLFFSGISIRCLLPGK